MTLSAPMVALLLLIFCLILDWERINDPRRLDRPWSWRRDAVPLFFVLVYLLFVAGRYGWLPKDQHCLTASSMIPVERPHHKQVRKP
jgi:uncharacterized membrane protein YjdF